VFEDLLAANQTYRSAILDPEIKGIAAKGLAIVTCIDSRIDPLVMLGLQRGDAKILRNAGARVTEDVTRSLILATNFLGVSRICLVQHTDCAMVGKTDADFQGLLSDKYGIQADDWKFLTIQDPVKTLASDMARLHSCPLLPSDTEVGGFILDVYTGSLTRHV